MCPNKLIVHTEPGASYWSVMSVYVFVFVYIYFNFISSLSGDVANDKLIQGV